MASSRAKGVCFIRHVEAVFFQEPETYEKFKLVLKQFRLRNVPSSYVVVTINKLFQNHPNLLLDFKAFVPPNYSPADAAAAADQADSVDFLNKVASRFTGNNGGVYRQFLDLMVSYSNGQYTVSQVRDKVFRLFKRHQDLASEFVSFLPESESSNCKSTSSKDTGAKIIRVSETRKRKKEQDGGDDKVTAPSRKRAKGAVEKGKVDFDLEDALCDAEVQISNLTSAYTHAKKLAQSITDGSLSPGDVRLEEHFTPLTLACVRKQCRKIRVREQNILSEIPKLLRALTKKKEDYEKSRVKLLSDMKKYLQDLYSSQRR